MTLRIVSLWSSIRMGFWFIPALMAAAAAALAVAADRIDRTFDTGAAGWIYGGSAGGARELLSVAAGSMITIAGVVFSITIVALSLASQQFGPRLLRNFIRDRGNQIVLGSFIATFLYCLLVLRNVRGGEGIEESEAYVPGASVTIGVMLAVLGVGVLIYFIHHVATSIQANNVIARVAGELDNAVRRLYPEPLGRSAQHGSWKDAAEHLEIAFGPPVPIQSNRSGYVTAIDGGAIMSAAREGGAVLWLRGRPGKFIVRGDAIAAAWPHAAYSDDLGRRVCQAYVIGAARTAEQDVEFSFDQLVEVAARALSPGINDPFTAIACIHRVHAALVTMLEREPEPALRYEGDVLRVIAPGPSVEEVLRAAIGGMRRYGSRDALVAAELLNVLASISERAPGRMYALIREEAAAVLESARQSGMVDVDVAPLRRLVEGVYIATGKVPDEASGARS